MNKYTFIHECLSGLRINVDAVNVSMAHILLKQKIAQVYTDNGICIPVNGWKISHEEVIDES